MGSDKVQAPAVVGSEPRDLTSETPPRPPPVPKPTETPLPQLMAYFTHCRVNSSLSLLNPFLLSLGNNCPRLSCCSHRCINTQLGLLIHQGVWRVPSHLGASDGWGWKILCCGDTVVDTMGGGALT